MSFFKRKEKNVIPEPERPDYSRQGSAGGPVGGGSGGGSTNSRGGLFGKKKEEADPEGFEKLPGRKYQRDQYNYQPSQRQQPAGGYGNYGNYQQQQPGAGEQQRDAGSGGAAAGGYGAYGGYQNNPDARNELFKGSRPPNSQTGAAFDQYAGSGGNRSGAPGNRAAAGQQSDAPDYGEGGQEDAGDGYGQDQEQTEEDDEVEAIKQQIRFTKQESLSATRNAIRTAREAEETATNTLAKLGQQTDRISNTELALDRAKGYNSRAADGAKEIKRLNQSIFKPSIQFNKAAKRDAEEQRILARHLEEKADREEARQAAFASRQRVEQGFREAEQSTRGRFGFNRGGSSSNNDDGEGLSGAPKTGRAKWEQGGRYQFEATNSDDELEQELDGNLDEIAGLTSRLKILASTAGKEIDAQNKHLDKVSGKVDTLDDKILMNTQYLKRIK